MPPSSERIRALKLLIGGLDPETRHEFWPAPDLEGGVPKGVIIELLGSSRAEWFLQFLKMNEGFRVFWCEREQSILPTAIHQRGVDLRRITFASLGEELYQPLRRVIQSQLYKAVLAPNEFREIRIFKAFQLLSEKSGCNLFLLGKDQPCSAWPISLQLKIQRAQLTQKSFQIEIIKQKHSRLS